MSLSLAVGSVWAGDPIVVWSFTFLFIAMLNFSRFMGLVARFLQDGEAMSVVTTGCGDYVIEFRTREVYLQFKSEFEKWLVFRDDDARYEWSTISNSLTIDWYI